MAFVKLLPLSHLFKKEKQRAGSVKREFPNTMDMTDMLLGKTH